MAAVYVSHTTGVASRSVTVPVGSDRVLIAVAYSSAASVARSATYGGVAMSVATTDNDWVQIFYMLDPPEGAATLAVTGTSISVVLAAHYTGIDSFQAGSAQENTGTPSGSFSPTRAALIVTGISSGSASHTPVASTTERYDSGGDWYGERIVAGSGAVTVGASAATDPDFAGAIFLEPVAAVSVSGTPAAPKPTVAGTASVVVAATGTPAAPKPTVSGTASVVVSTSGTPAAPRPTATGTASVVASASGTPSAPPPTVSGSVTVGALGVQVSGSAAAPRPTASGSASVTVAASGTPSAPKPTSSGTATVVVAASGTPTAPRPTVSGTVSFIENVAGLVTATVAQEGRARASVACEGALSISVARAGRVTSSVSGNP